MGSVLDCINGGAQQTKDLLSLSLSVSAPRPADNTRVRTLLDMRIKQSHGFAAIVAAGRALLMQVFITHGFAPSSLHLAHLKQLVALIPKVMSDLGCIVLVGPISPAMLRRDVYLIAFVSCFLPHLYRTSSAAARHAAYRSPDTLLVVIQSAGTLAINLATFIFHLMSGYSVWGCLRLTHALVGAYGLALCIVHRFNSETHSAVEFPPLRGSFEGGVCVYLLFIGMSWQMTPTRRLLVHANLANIFPEGWLPLSELKPDELKTLLKDEAEACRPRRLAGGHTIGWRAVHASGQQLASDAPSAPWVGHELYELERCGASTLGSDSEVGELGATAEQQAVHPELEAEEAQLRDRAYSSCAYYERQDALLRTLEVCGLEFPDDDDR